MSNPVLSNPDTVAAPVAAYSQLAHVKAGSDLFWIAGQVGLRSDGSLPESFAEQASETFANIVRILQAQGMTTSNLVKINTYLVHGHPVGAAREARVKHMGDVRPASTMVYVPALADPKWLIEVEAVAAR